MNTHQRRRSPAGTIEPEDPDSRTGWPAAEGAPPPRPFRSAATNNEAATSEDDERGAPPARVLVVEDEESFVDALTVNLEREGFSVTVAR